jgi:V-type H+-transporting ATPase subunit d
MITINSFGTELSKDDRVKLFPTCGKLYPEGLAVLAKADEYEQVKAVADYYTVGNGPYNHLSQQPHGAKMDLFPNEQNFDLNKSRQKCHHSLKEHHKISNIPKFRCEML